MTQWRKIMPGVFEGLPLAASLHGGNSKEPDLLEKLSNIPFITKKTHRFDTWQHRGQEPWWDTVKQYSGGDYGHPFLTLLGTVGTGKTRLAWSIGWDWLERGLGVLYYQVEALLDALREGYSKWEKGDPDGYQKVLQHTQNTKLLILDDFGTEYGTIWAAAKLNQIVDYRYEHRKPLIAITNLALTRLPERIADRLTEGELVQLTGESFRKQKKQKEKRIPRRSEGV